MNFGKTRAMAAMMPRATAAAASHGTIERVEISRFGETLPASCTASRVSSSTRRPEASTSLADARPTTEERRSSSSGWLRSMNAAISQGS